MVRLSLTLLAVTIAAGSVRADHFAIELKVQVGKAVKTARTETIALGAKPKAREVLRARAGDRVKVNWSLTNTDARAAVKNVLVYFFAVREEELGQKNVPALTAGVVAQSALTMDFNPKDVARGELNFVIDRPGPYLVRVETRGAAAGAARHEHFAALEILVEEGSP
jgi:hypothetical protein